uniref:Adhesion G protein-coupled receptor F7 n=1 Tax=Xiphophorus couchianus TaxID=32473 RepID=A0A3B5KS57_9TELE
MTTVTNPTTPEITTVTNATTSEITVTNVTPDITTLTNATTPEITTVTNATAPEITVTNATTPKITTVTNLTTPEITMTNATTPEITTVTNATAPEITVTNATTPKITTVTNVITPEISMTNATTPEITTVTNATAPEITVTNATTPKITTVTNVITPEITMTNATTPEITKVTNATSEITTMTNATTPEITVTNATTPEIATVTNATPEITTVTNTTTEITVTNATTPEITVAKATTPEITVTNATPPPKITTVTDATLTNITMIFATTPEMTTVTNTTSKMTTVTTKIIPTNLLESAGILTSDAAKGSWDELNNNNKSESSENKNASSSFLSAFEGIAAHVVNEPLSINTQYILFTKVNFTNNFKDDFNSSVEINIPEAEGSRQSIAVMLFASMDNVLPARESVNTSSSVINGRVVLIHPESDINNISIAFDVLNETLGKPKCVFWDFDLFDSLGGWSDEGCAFVLNENGTVRCNCNHTTSFSILMSPDSPQDIVLDFITYIGLGISMGSLIVCLIIEGIAWRKIRRHSTSYLRHVSIVNIAVSLLIADIWFIIGAAVSNTKSAPACTYIRENVVCWLNWNQSKALLAFVVPALMIVVINLIILVVVLYKILSRRGGANASQAEGKNVLYVIARSLAVLTPLFGLTWGLGVGVMLSPKNRGMQITFALFNSVQGCFIWVFGTLLDKKVCMSLVKSNLVCLRD